MSDDKTENPEIIVDEGWKSQVEKERQLAAANKEAAADDTAQAEGDGDEYEMTIFDSLVSGLAAQTMVALGLTGEEGQQVQVDMAYAHHLISSLIMLQEKTAGNLDEAEADNLDEAVGELHRVFMIREDQIREMQGEEGVQPGPEDNIHKLHIPGQD
jgi:hypothetical protein